MLARTLGRLDRFRAAPQSTPAILDMPIFSADSFSEKEDPYMVLSLSLPRRGRITAPRLRVRAFRGSILIGGRRIGVHVGVIKNTLAVGMKRSEERTRCSLLRTTSLGRFVLRVCKSKLPLCAEVLVACCHRSLSSPGPDNFLQLHMYH